LLGSGSSDVIAKSTVAFNSLAAPGYFREAKMDTPSGRARAARATLAAAERPQW
jgi:hypothetical protein